MSSFVFLWETGRKLVNGQNLKLNTFTPMIREDKYIRFDWAMKRLLRNKANFAVLEGLLTTLLGEKITIGGYWRARATRKRSLTSTTAWTCWRKTRTDNCCSSKSKTTTSTPISSVCCSEPRSWLRSTSTGATLIRTSERSTV